jgi:hypothetical protein
MEGPRPAGAAAARPLAGAPHGDRRAVGDAVRREVARALGDGVPRPGGPRAVSVDRIRLRLPAGATAADVGAAVAAAIVRALGRRGRP